MNLISPNVLDYIPLSEDYTIYELAPPSAFLKDNRRSPSEE
jgi:hypothetical protein